MLQPFQGPWQLRRLLQVLCLPFGTRGGAHFCPLHQESESVNHSIWTCIYDVGHEACLRPWATLWPLLVVLPIYSPSPSHSNITRWGNLCFIDTWMLASQGVSHKCTMFNSINNMGSKLTDLIGTHRKCFMRSINVHATVQKGCQRPSWLWNTAHCTESKYMCSKARETT